MHCKYYKIKKIKLQKIFIKNNKFQICPLTIPVFYFNLKKPTKPLNWFKLFLLIFALSIKIIKLIIKNINKNLLNSSNFNIWSIITIDCTL